MIVILVVKDIKYNLLSQRRAFLKQGVKMKNKKPVRIIQLAFI
jgi:hypothetical protein